VLPSSPGRARYENEVVKRWTAEIAASDGFVFVTPEYNYGPAAVLKNAIDWVYPEWNRKAAAFVSYGGALGARSVQQLREVAIELQIAPVRSSVHIPLRPFGRITRAATWTKDSPSLRHPRRC
jgi:NAD(P)H-dependent FMN reductase